MRLFFFGIIICVFFYPSFGRAETPACVMKVSFDSPEDMTDWRAVNDGVMGGLSSGGPETGDGHMVFTGVLNTNGGGFSSIRRKMQPGQLKDIDSLDLRIRSDGRAYKVTMRTDVRYRFRPISFQIEIPSVPAGQWTDVNVPFSRIKASIFGRPVRGAEFDPAAIRELGIIIADGKDGPFRLDVASIEACPKS